MEPNTSDLHDLEDEETDRLVVESTSLQLEANWASSSTNSSESVGNYTRKSIEWTWTVDSPTEEWPLPVDSWQRLASGRGVTFFGLVHLFREWRNQSQWIATFRLQGQWVWSRGQFAPETISEISLGHDSQWNSRQLKTWLSNPTDAMLHVDLTASNDDDDVVLLTFESTRTTSSSVQVAPHDRQAISLLVTPRVDSRATFRGSLAFRCKVTARNRNGPRLRSCIVQGVVQGAPLSFRKLQWHQDEAQLILPDCRVGGPSGIISSEARFVMENVTSEDQDIRLRGHLEEQLESILHVQCFAMAD